MSTPLRSFVVVAAAVVMIAIGGSAGFAGDPSATGQIVDAGGRPAPGVPLKVTGPIETVVVTDGNGVWTLYGLPPGTYQVVPFNDPFSQGAMFTIRNNAAGPENVTRLRLH